MRRALLAFAGIVGGGFAYTRLLKGRRDRIDVYYDDGSFVTYVDGSTDAQRLLPLARDILAAVHG